jgi:hypothetical protein
MNVLNVRYDVYGGVPDDLVRSELPLSITVSHRFGTSRLVFRTARRLYRILVRVGQFEICDCAPIRFFKMLKKLEIHPKMTGRGRCDVPEPAEEKNSLR